MKEMSQAGRLEEKVTRNGTAKNFFAKKYFANCWCTVGRQAGRQAGRRARSIQRDSSSSCGAGPDAAAIGRRISCGKQAGKQICSTRFLKRIIKIFSVL
jgi:hypothetical protein